MTATELSIDITRLEKVRRHGSKLTARCPACAATGGDRSGEHIVILPNGKFACAALPGDTEHRREIFALVGIKGERRRDPERDREWRETRKRERDTAEARKRFIDVARTKRDAIIARHPWELADVWESSPTRIDQPLTQLDPRFFISALFPEDATIWTGKFIHSGTRRHGDHWRTVRNWQDAHVSEVGPMVSPAIWPPGTISRAAANVISSPYVVLDFDGFDGISPKTPAEIEKHIADSLAITRWLREALRWHLAAILHSGNKSIHAWFHSPPPAVLYSLRDAAKALGIDAGLIGHGEHPARLPGQRHAKTGILSRVLYLQNPIA